MPLTLRSPALSAHGIRHGFSLRQGGASRAPFDSLNLARNVGDDPAAVHENHARYAAAVGYDVTRLYEVQQVHGARILEVDARTTPAVFRVAEADALLTDVPGVAVGVRVADCVAVLLAARGTGAVAAVHSGWRGTVENVVGQAVGALCTLARCAPDAVIAAVFPHIGPDAFEVGAEVADAMTRAIPEDPQVVHARLPRPHVNLGRAVTYQLTRAGLAREAIDVISGCTFAEPARFFSFRRDGQASGRHLAAIVGGC